MKKLTSEFTLTDILLGKDLRRKKIEVNLFDKTLSLVVTPPPTQNLQL